MVMLVISKRLTHREALENMLEIERWFLKHPRRRVCRTQYWVVRRNYIVQDILHHTENYPGMSWL